MATLTENLRRTAHYLVSEATGYRSRSTIVIASGSGKLEPGAVLGKVTASGKYKPVAPAANDGSQTAAVILFEGCDATAADVRRTANVRDCEVQAEALVWPAGVTDVQKTAALGQLAAAGIVSR